MRMFAAIFVLLCSAWLAAPAEEQKPLIIGPMLWATPIEGFGVHGGEPPATKSILTPDNEITVTRMEAFDEQGPMLNINGVTTQFVPCSPQPTLTITDGITTHTLVLSNTFLPKSSSTYSDSGPLKLRFSAGTQVRLVIAGPPVRQTALCVSRGFSLLVHYTVKP